MSNQSTMKADKFYNFFLMVTSLFIMSCGSSNRDKAFQNIEENAGVNSTPKPLENSIKIGSQVWAKNNLNVDRFRNGDFIMEAKSDEDWEKAGAEGKPAWCYYNNDSSFGTKYGKLYNFYAVHDQRGLAPIGAHIATDEEWTTLSNNLGGDDIAGIKLKSTKGWAGKGNGDNASGFNALPGGYRYFSGIFFNEGQDGSWWTATPNEEGYALLRYLYSANTNIFRNRLNLKLGLSVRCIQD